MQVNHYSSFLLTNLLIGLLKKSSPSRIINVSSVLAKYATTFHVNKIDDYFPKNVNYHNSKLCNVLFTMELAKKLQGTGVTAYSLHPGVVKTNIYHNFKEIRGIIYPVFAYLYGKTSEEGAQTTLHCALAKGIEGESGSYFADCKKESPFHLMTKDPGLPKKVWEKTEQIVNLRPDEIQF